MLMAAITAVRADLRAARAAASSADVGRQLAMLRFADALDRLRVAADNLQREEVSGGTASDTAAALEAAVAELMAALASGRDALEPSLLRALERVAALADDRVAALTGRNRSPRSDTVSAEARPTRICRGASASPAKAVIEPAEPLLEQADFSAAPAACFGAAAPREAAPGAHFAVHCVAYPEGAGDAARALLSEAQDDARIVGDVAGEPLALGTRVEVALSGEHLLIEGQPREVQAFRWTGRTTLLGFDATLAADAVATVLRLDIMVDGIVLARIRMPLAVSARPDASLRQASAEVSMAKTACFASYSSHDRQRVLDRVAAIRIAARVEVFLDCHDLHPGEAWRPRLERAIDACDAFLLFWSEAAAKSKWVKWEWQRALAKPGLAAMQFHPLENGVEPPGALAGVHLGDPYMDLRAAERLRRAGASNLEAT